MEVEVNRQGPRERRAHHRCVTDGVSTRDWPRERVEVDPMPHNDLRRVLCVELWTTMEAWTIMRLECLTASHCILKDHAAERCTARLWHVLDEQVLTTCQRPRRTLLLVGHRCLRLILDAYQRVRLPVTAGRVPVEDRLQAVPSGVRAATRHPPVCPLVHHLDDRAI
eukprot:scaffold22815_cov60-Phaeocystis_antarctica.AAC.2